MQERPLLRKVRFAMLERKEKVFLPLPQSFIICVIAIRALPRIYFPFAKRQRRKFSGGIRDVGNILQIEKSDFFRSEGHK